MPALIPFRSPAKKLSMMHELAYLRPPGNQSDIASFLKDLGLGEWDGVVLCGDLLH